METHVGLMGVELRSCHTQNVSHNSKFEFFGVKKQIIFDVDIIELTIANTPTEVDRQFFIYNYNKLAC